MKRVVAAPRQNATQTPIVSWRFSSFYWINISLHFCTPVVSFQSSEMVVLGSVIQFYCGFVWRKFAELFTWTFRKALQVFFVFVVLLLLKFA